MSYSYAHGSNSLISNSKQDKGEEMGLEGIEDGTGKEWRHPKPIWLHSGREGDPPRV